MSRGDWDEQAVNMAAAELLEAWRISGLSGDDLHLGLDHDWEVGPKARLVEFVEANAQGLPASEGEYLLYQDSQELKVLKADILRDTQPKPSPPSRADWLL